MMRHALRTETYAEDVAIIGTVAYEERSVRLADEFHLGFFPSKWTPIPAALLHTDDNEHVHDKQSNYVRLRSPA